MYGIAKEFLFENFEFLSPDLPVSIYFHISPALDLGPQAVPTSVRPRGYLVVGWIHEMIGSVITWIAGGAGFGSAASSVSRGTTAAASEARAPLAAPIALPAQTHVAILSGCNRHSVRSSSSPGNVNSASTTATTSDPARRLSHRGSPLAHAADTGTPPRLLPAGDCPPAMMNRSRPSSRRQSNVASSGKTPTNPQPPCRTLTVWTRRQAHVSRGHPGV